MSSHREAPEIAKDPVADSTDVYAFMHPTKRNTVVLIANFIPLQQPNGGPNFYEFSDDVLYEINISNSDAITADIRYQFKFNTRVRNPNTFLYNTGPIGSLTDTAWNRPQTYTVTKVQNGRSTVIARNLPVPPVNVGPRSTPDYQKLSDAAVKTVGRRTFFAGQRTDAFHVDLGSIFDLGALRPFNEAHIINLPEMGGVNSVQSYNVHTIAMELPAGELTPDRRAPSADVNARRNVIGVWSTASRRKGRVYNGRLGKYEDNGPWVQVSRLANPLVNEVLIPMVQKDNWNSRRPAGDSKFRQYVDKPELAGLLPVLYPGVFPRLAEYDKPRADLNAILHTGIPTGVVPGFQNYTGPRQADVLRLNMSIPPSAQENPLGVVGGDLAGFPNGRRVGDDVVAIELRAIAGVTIPLVDPSFTPDDAAGALTDGTTDDTQPDRPTSLPFLSLPGSGYSTVPGTAEAS